MGKVVPNRPQSRLMFYVVHGPVWADRAEEIGLDPVDVARLGEMTAAARAAQLDSAQAAQAARAAGAVYRRLLGDLSSFGADQVKKIKAHAASAPAGAGSVYTAAMISPPDDPSPIGPPGTPTGLAHTLYPDGSLLLKWTCRNPKKSQGTLYEIWRRPAGLSNAPENWTFLGTSGLKKFVDDTLVAGTPAVVYQITGVRSTRRGTAGQFTVNLGRQRGDIRARSGAGGGGGAGGKMVVGPGALPQAAA